MKWNNLHIVGLERSHQLHHLWDIQNSRYIPPYLRYEQLWILLPRHCVEIRAWGLSRTNYLMVSTPFSLLFYTTYPQRGSLLATIPFSRKWEPCVKLRTCSCGSLHRRSSGLIQTPVSTRGEELTAELWFFVLYNDQEIRLFHSTITADLCLAELHDRTEAGNKACFWMKSGTKNMRSRSKFPGLPWQHTVLFNKLGDLARNPVFNASPHLGGQIAERSAILPGQSSNTRACVPEMW